jgi:asparagine synthase (glutamine-hydrolysing)
MREVLADPTAPIRTLIDADQIGRLIDGDLSPAATPWFGQLMSGPQMLAYLLQVNDWLKHFRIALL